MSTYLHLVLHHFRSGLIHEIGSTRTSMVTYRFPLGGVILGVTFMCEQLVSQVIAGAALIVVSLAIANWEPRQEDLSALQQTLSS